MKISTIYCQISSHACRQSQVVTFIKIDKTVSIHFMAVIGNFSPRHFYISGSKSDDSESVCAACGSFFVAFAQIDSSQATICHPVFTPSSPLLQMPAPSVAQQAAMRPSTAVI